MQHEWAVTGYEIDHFLLLDMYIDFLSLIFQHKNTSNYFLGFCPRCDFMIKSSH